MSMLANVILPLPKYKDFDYQVNTQVTNKLKVGSIVKVPFGRKQKNLVGMIKNLSAAGSKPKPNYEIKELSEHLSEINLPGDLVELLSWVAEHYLYPEGEVLRCVLPGMLLKGAKSRGQRAKKNRSNTDFGSKTQLILNQEQARAVQAVLMAQGQYQPFLLQGVTGSGKTEVYLQVVAEILSKGKSSLILVPEIALTPQLVGRFVARFGEDVVASFHSGLTEAKRMQVWWQVYQKEKKVIIGTRSAVFLPFSDLAMMVVDEEHDSSYKQDERLRYHARDVAVMRAYLAKIPILLGSATPALETFYNVAQGKYQLLKLCERATGGELPTLHFVDLTKTSWDQDSLLSGPLIEALQQCLERGEQSILFLNRRGFAPFMLCTFCGYIKKCPNCDINMVWHGGENLLKCHYCEISAAGISDCPQCSSQLKPMGTGTERLEQKLNDLFPNARVARLDRDTAHNAQAGENILSDFLNHEYDILVGTQMVVKGHDFPKLTLVGVMLADQGFYSADFRGIERGVQMLTQVAGRSGRHEKSGEVFIQYFNPRIGELRDHLAGDIDVIYQQELSLREALQYPPFVRMVLLRMSGNDKVKVLQNIQILRNTLQEYLKAELTEPASLVMMGPAAPVVEKLRGKYRMQLLLKVKQWPKIRKKLLNLLKELENQVPSGVTLYVDVDPVSNL